MSDDSPATSVSDLFSRDPSLLKESEIDLIIEDLRAKRQLWATGDKQAGSAKRAKPKLTKAEQEASSLNLGSKPIDLASLLKK